MSFLNIFILIAIGYHSLLIPALDCTHIKKMFVGNINTIQFEHLAVLIKEYKKYVEIKKIYYNLESPGK